MKGSRLGLRLLAGGVLLAAVLVTAAGGSARHAAARTSGSPLVAQPLQAKKQTQPRPTSSCVMLLGIRCYSPSQFAKAYRLNELNSAGIDGSGETIAIVDSFGSPTIANDLHQFDQTFGVSNPYGVPVDPAIAQDPSLTIIQPAGAVPAFDPSNSDMVGWAEETTLDVEWAHVMAPKANILLVETPTSETEGTAGFPEIVTAENYVIQNHLANVISQSFGATEETFPSQKSLLDLRTAYQNAQKNHITVLGASGDEGSTDFELNLEDLFPMQVDSWPSSDPLVTSIGGTQMNLDDAGTRLSSDVVWNDSAVGIQAAGGGGVSAVFHRPHFQKGVKSVVGNHRGTPDVSLNAAVDGGVWVYYTFITPTSPYHIFGGTSAATPEFAGVVALADQVAGGSLGDINKALYSIPYGGGLVDVTSGNNDIGPFENSDGNTYHVPGFDAATGYDLASGLGTVDPARFVAALANAASPRPHPGPGHDVTCTGTMTFASILGRLVVPKGASCTLTDSVVHNNADVAGSLTLNGSTIRHDVHVRKGASFTQNPDSGGEPSIVEGKVHH
jgi:subtilase family serine protease